jgi:16S rRNA (guanine527-N7)-methyltransferase
LTESPHRAPLEALALPPPAIGPLAAYLDLLAAWNSRTNLTGARTPAARVQILVADVLLGLPFLEPGSLLDIGSGNGSPGLVLALLRPEAPATLLEPRARRWAFLREAARLVGRPDIAILRQRHDEYRGAPAQNLTLRALALPPEELAGLAFADGRLLVYGAEPPPCTSWVRELDGPPPPSRLHVYRRARFT